jgi:hypothetical protein
MSIRPRPVRRLGKEAEAASGDQRRTTMRVMVFVKATKDSEQDLVHQLLAQDRSQDRLLENSLPVDFRFPKDYTGLRLPVLHLHWEKASC